MSTSSPIIRIWLWTGVVLISAMVMIGGITRLTGSGLSIVEWKIVSGVFPPLNSEQWQTEFDNYKQFPQYKQLNVGMTLGEFKSIYTWEYVHRLLGRFIGIVFILPFIFFWIRGMLSTRLFRQLMLVLVLGALQGLAGWIMVQSGLRDAPHVSHFRLAIHLVLALMLIAAILWIIVDLKQGVPTKDRPTLHFPTACLLLLVMQIVLGAFVAGLKAGSSYNNFPMMGKSFLPSLAVVRSQTIFYNGALLQFVHRWLAFIVFGAIILLWKVSSTIAETQPYGTALVILTILQILLGVLTLIFGVPIVVAVAHQFVAVVLFITIMMTVLKLHYVRT